MPIWRRILCVAIGAPLAIAGVWLFGTLQEGPTHSYLLYGTALTLVLIGGLLALSGLLPSLMRDY